MSPIQQIGLLLLLYFCSVFNSFGQSQNNQWRFGYNCGINFNSGAPVNAAGCQMQTLEGSASIADKNTGALLFYTDGLTVWNASNAVMPNGTGLLGGTPVAANPGNPLSSTSAAVIVPRPYTPNIYYIITIDQQDANNGVRYSVVDMTLNGGLGNIVSGQKNILLFATTSEKLQVVPAADGCSYWLITHNNPGNSFYTFNISQAGINTTPVVSSVGTVQQSGLGHIKVNRQLNKIAMGNSYFLDYKIELFDFNNATGIISNPVAWNYAFAYSGLAFFGIEFSPDGRKLYISNFLRLLQYDISLATPALIEASGFNVTQTSTVSLLGSLQLGPDNKIYISSTPLSVVNAPNNAGAACNLQENPVPGFSGTIKYGLPQWIYTLQRPVLNNAIIYSDTCLSAATQLSVQNTADIISVFWNFGDLSSGAANTTTGNTATHIFSQAGQYTVSAITNYACYKDTLYQVFTIRDCTLPGIIGIKIAGDTCDASSAIIFQVLGTSSSPYFSWNFGDPASGVNNTALITGPSPDPNPPHLFSAPGTYTICASFQEPGFPVSQICRTIEIGLCCNGLPTSSTTNINICSSQLPYNWNGTPYNAAGTYSTTLVNAAGCDSVATLVLLVNSSSCCIPGIINNGSFNSPLGFNTIAPGWTGTNPAVNTPDINNATSPCNAGNGFNWLGTPLPSANGGTWQNLFDAEVIIQNVNTIPGQQYQLCFEYASQYISTGFFDFSIPAGVVININGSIVNVTPTDPTPFTWENWCYTFTATTVVTTITLKSTFGYLGIDGVTLNSTNSLTLTETHINTTCGNANGSINLTVSGGTAPYSYLWSNGATTQDITGLASNSYTVTVTDANNCTQTLLVVINNSTGITLSETHINATCGNSNGSIDLTVTGGIATITYLWSNGAATQDITGLAANNYSVTVTNGNGCTATVATLITNTTPPTISPIYHD